MKLQIFPKLFLSVAVFCSCVKAEKRSLRQALLQGNALNGAEKSISELTLREEDERLLLRAMDIYSGDDQFKRELLAGGASIRCEGFSVPWDVVKTLDSASYYCGKCASSLAPVVASTSKMFTNMTDISTSIYDTYAKMTRLKSLTADTYRQGQALTKLSYLPKTANMLKAYLEVLDPARKLIEQLHTRLGGIAQFMMKLLPASKNLAKELAHILANAKDCHKAYSEAASVIKTTMVCATGKSDCSENARIVSHSRKIRPHAVEVERYSQACPRVLTTLTPKVSAVASSTDVGIFKALQKAVEDVGKRLSPVIAGLVKSMDIVAKQLTEKSCCSTALKSQHGFKYLSQALGLDKCWIKASKSKLDAALTALRRAMTTLIEEFVRKVFYVFPNLLFYENGDQARVSCE